MGKGRQKPSAGPADLSAWSLFRLVGPPPGVEGRWWKMLLNIRNTHFVNWCPLCYDCPAASPQALERRRQKPAAGESPPQAKAPQALERRRRKALSKVAVDAFLYNTNWDWWLANAAKIAPERASHPTANLFPMEEVNAW